MPILFDRRRRLLLLAGSAALCPLPAFAGTKPDADHRLHLGVINERANQPDHVLAQYTSLLERLRLSLAPQRIAVGELRIARNIDELAALIRSGKVDVVFESVISTFRLDPGGSLVQPALAAWRKGRRETRSVFFVRQTSPIRNLRDLAGKLLALESPRSTTAYSLPKIVLHQHGLRVEAFGRDDPAANSVRFVLADSEANQAYWVDRGRADAGAFSTEDWDDLPNGLRRGLRVIHTSDPILRWLLSARAGLSPLLLGSVQAALCAMHADADGAEALHKAGRIRRLDRLGPPDLAALDHWRNIALRSRFGE